ncbi:NAD-dependent epimerase/dehydratase family protein [Phaeovibrio sulfidiphilus]|uniref:NAD-dependent epimerase/dehydratase family protein n=1 Tax=Phaeovibrio sulfidiphilus TaxID=1220600 RepID=A0A8J7CWD0_9PROT|nr:NAD-dependent epimerase/dehydratase family protein [Phaeovibrio sulfidiphilus]MBE1237336.1 NAD-dependent epimerase/dehydratase family protein [Phaeovibrio sulfidiphilus]
MKTILVLGAGGFLGSRIARFLAAQDGMTVRVGHRGNTVDLPAGPAFQPVMADLLDVSSLEKAFDGVDVVVNATRGDRLVSVNGVQAILDAARTKGVRRVVHLSSATVYGRATGSVTEDAPLDPIQDSDDEETLWKVEAESLCARCAGPDLSVVVLRLPVVFGAGATHWAGTMARRLAERRWGTIGEFGEGLFNAIDPQDVGSAVAAAATAPETVGGVYNVRGPTVTSWNDYFRSYNAALGFGELAPLSMGRFGYGYLFGGLTRKMVGALPVSGTVRDALSPDVPTTAELDRFRFDVIYATDKAARDLGWTPQVPLEQSMQEAARWAMETGRADTAGAARPIVTRSGASGSDNTSGGPDAAQEGAKALGEEVMALGEHLRKGVGVFAKTLKDVGGTLGDKIRDVSEDLGDKLKDAAEKTGGDSAGSSDGTKKAGGLGEIFRAAAERRMQLREEIQAEPGTGGDAGESEKRPLGQRLFPSHIIFKKMPEGGPDVSLGEALLELRGKKVDLDAMTPEERDAYKAHLEAKARLFSKVFPNLIATGDAKDEKKPGAAGSSNAAAGSDTKPGSTGSGSGTGAAS